MGERDGGGSRGIFAWVSLRLVMYFIWAIVAVALFGVEFPHALDGTPSVGSPAVPNYLRNLLELLSFASNIGLIVTAIWAGFYAKRQLDSAREQSAIALSSTKAGVYSALYDKVASNEVQAGLRLQGAICDLYKAATPTGQSLGEFAIATMVDWYSTKKENFAVSTNFLAFLEHVGLTVRRDYLDMDDVYYLLEGPLKDATATFGDYLKKLRDASEDKRMCEHAIWLLTEIQHYKPKAKLP